MVPEAGDESCMNDGSLNPWKASRDPLPIPVEGPAAGAGAGAGAGSAIWQAGHRKRWPSACLQRALNVRDALYRGRRLQAPITTHTCNTLSGALHPRDGVGFEPSATIWELDQTCPAASLSRPCVGFFPDLRRSALV